MFRAEAGHLTTWLMHSLGDFCIAEDVVQDALLIALERWPVEGVPASPRAWLRTVARRRAIDRLRRDITFRNKLQRLQQQTEDDEPDKRLQLIFMCCHPALAPEAAVALTLRAVCGLTTPEIASGFLLSETSVAQRIVRARRKIVAAGIPYRMPREDELDERVQHVLSVLYLMCNEGYLASGGGSAARHDVAEDAAWLAELLAGLFPANAEVLGLVALMRLHLARADARFDAAGNLVLLRDQDRRRWDRARIDAAIKLIERAAALRRPGAYQLQAAIAACHAEAANWDATDWPQILLLYDMLLRVAPGPVARLNRAVAVWHVAGPELALAQVQALSGALDGYHLFHAIQAELLDATAQHEPARTEKLRALELTHNPAEQSLPRQRVLAGQC